MREGWQATDGGNHMGRVASPLMLSRPFIEVSYKPHPSEPTARYAHS